MAQRRRMIECGFSVLILLTVLVAGAGASELADAFAERWRWVHFTTDSGLPSDDINDLVEAVDGTPWVATGAGLAWYDGHRWRPMTEREGMPQHQVGSLAVRETGGVIAVVEGAAYVGDTGGFRRLLSPPGRVSAVACLAGDVVLAQVGEALYRLERDGRHERVIIESEHESVAQLYASRPGRALVMTSTSLHLWDGSEWTTVVDFGARGQVWADIRQALDVGDGDVLYTVQQPYFSQGAWWRKRGREPIRIDLRSAESVVEAAARSDGTVVLAHESGAIGLNEGLEGWKSVSLPPAIGGVTTLAFQDNGDLWAGTTRGLWLFRRSSQRWHVPERSPEADANVIHALLRAADGRLWVGTRAGLEVRSEDGRIESLSSIEGVPIPIVTTIAEDGDGAIWIGSGSGFEGAWRFQDGTWRHFGEADGLTAPHVHAVRVDRDGRPWFLGLSRHAFRGGPGALVHEDAAFRPISLPGGEQSQRVYDFAEGPKGTYWFATQGGLHRLSEGRWRSWSVAEGLPSPRVFTLELDDRDRPWMSAGDGACYLPDDDTIECESLEVGLPNDAVWDLAFDSTGALWASTRGGLGVRRDGAWSRLLPHHGLPLLRLWPLLVEDDRLLIGTNGRGMAELRLAEATEPPPRVSFRELEVDLDSARVEWSTDAWWGAQAEGEVENRWRLDGGPWSRWSRRRELPIEDLAPGPHRLEVEAKGLLAQRGPAEVLDFNVPVPLHARPEVWVPTLLVLVMGLSWLGFSAWRRRSYLRELADRERRFSDILDNVADVIFTADLDGRLTSLNRAGVELAGLGDRNAAELNWRELLRSTSLERASDALQRKIEGVDSSTYEIEVPGADGELHVLEVHSRLVRGRDRKPEIQGVARDVSERRRLEAQLHHAQKMESLGLLAGGVAHDFNNLLLSILGNLDLARGAWREGRSPRQAFDDLESAAERATDLARVMLAYSGKARFEIRPLDLSELAAEILRLLRASLPKSIEFETDLADGLPAIEGDRAQIQQVILNLVTNAADAIGAEGGLISVRTGTGPAAESRFGEAAIDADLGEAAVSWLQVSDSGPGMDAETRRRIFDPFFTTKGTGRGLGLSAVLGIVRVHGGALHLDSSEHRGTRFRVLFPALDAPAPAPAADRRTSGSYPSAEDLRGARILVVDDEERVREVACRLLERAGCEVLSARDGLEAQEVVRDETGRLDVVLLDLVMPRCSGEEALVAIREISPDLPVVLTSGYTEQEASARQVGCGPTSFLMKPYRLTDLEQAILAAIVTRGRPQAQD